MAGQWRDDSFEPAPEQTADADRAIAALEDRGSPAHDGLAARLAAFEATDGELRMTLQPMRWAVRLGQDAAASLSVLCVARDADGRWLAGRRAPWVATWAGRWALGAGGSVELGEDPVEALISLPTGMVMLIGQAWLAEGAEVTRDAEHDAHAWWPPEPASWPDDADPVLRRMASLLA